MRDEQFTPQLGLDPQKRLYSDSGLPFGIAKSRKPVIYSPFSPICVKRGYFRKKQIAPFLHISRKGVILHFASYYMLSAVAAILESQVVVDQYDVHAVRDAVVSCGVEVAADSVAR